MPSEMRPADLAEAAYAMADMLAGHLRGDFIDEALLPVSAKRLISAYQAQHDGLPAFVVKRDQFGVLPAVPESAKRRGPTVIDVTPAPQPLP